MVDEREQTIDIDQEYLTEEELLQTFQNDYNFVKMTVERDSYSINWDELLEKLNANIKVGSLKEFLIDDDIQSKDRCIYFACAFNDLDFSKWLIANGASAAVSYFNSKSTLLHVVAKNGNKELAELLMKNGANIYYTDFQGNTPLHLAIKSNNPECTMFLAYLNSSQIAVANYQKETPIHFIARNGNLECIELIGLAMANAIIEGESITLMQNIEGKTILHLAAENGHYEYVDKFLSCYASPQIIDNNGETALHLAIKNSHYDCAIYLIKHMNKSSVCKKNKEGKTALQLVVLSNTDIWIQKREILILLLENTDNQDINAAYSYIKSVNDIRVLKVFQNYFLKQKQNMKKNSIKLEKQESWSRDFILYASNISSIVASVFVLINETPLCIKEVSFICIITIMSKILALLTIPAIIYAIKKHNELDLFYQTIEEHKTKIEETVDLTKVKREESNDLEIEVPYNHDRSGSNDWSSRKTSNQLALPLNTLEVHTTQQQEQNSYMFSKSELHPNELKRTFSFRQSSPASSILKAKPRAFSIPLSSTKLQSIPNEWESLAITQPKTTSLVEQHGNLNAISKRYCKSSVGSFKFSRPKQHAEQSQPLLSRSTPSVLMQAMSTNFTSTKELSHYDNISP